LYYLAIISHLALLASIVTQRLPKAFTGWFARLVDSASFRPHVLLLVGLLVASIPGVVDDGGQTRVEMGFVPNLSLVVYFSVWFSIGWIMYRNLAGLLADLTRFAWFNFVTCLVFAAFSYLAYNLWHSPWQPLVHELAVTFSAFAVIGLFMRYLHFENPSIRYLSNASYWMYLFHAPILFATIAALGHSGLNIYLVALIGIVVTVAVTLASYHWLVRPTIIGRYLSGRRRARRERALAGSELTRAQ
jgi:peptidoglycan/LPS O-acetylase OafA/YrhL